MVLHVMFLKLLFHRTAYVISNVSVIIPLYISTRAFSPASITSCVEAESEWNTFAACSWNILPVLNLLIIMAAPFPIP